jgi:hypothetical protein
LAKGKKKGIKKKGSSDQKPKKKAVAKAKPKLKQDLVPSDGAGIIVVEDDTNLDKEAELEARKAYLEEARSQEASED